MKNKHGTLFDLDGTEEGLNVNQGSTVSCLHGHHICANNNIVLSAGVRRVSCGAAHEGQITHILMCSTRVYGARTRGKTLGSLVVVAVHTFITTFPSEIPTLLQPNQ